MVSITSEYGLYLYTGKVDLRKGINCLCGIISCEMGHNPRKPKTFGIGAHLQTLQWWSLPNEVLRKLIGLFQSNKIDLERVEVMIKP